MQVVAAMEATIHDLQRKSTDQASKLQAAQGLRNQLNQAIARAEETELIAAQLSSAQQELDSTHATMLRVQKQVKDDERYYREKIDKLQASAAETELIMAAQTVCFRTNGQLHQCTCPKMIAQSETTLHCRLLAILNIETCRTVRSLRTDWHSEPCTLIAGTMLSGNWRADGKRRSLSLRHRNHTSEDIAGRCTEH
jgi:hypothetical protein